MKRVRTRGVRHNMSWTEIGAAVRNVSILPPKFQALIAAAKKRGHKWYATKYLRVDKSPGGKKQLGFALWIPKPEILAFSMTGLFVGETHEKTEFRYVRSHPLARTIKEAHHADVFTDWKRKGFRSHGYPNFAHWLEYREIRTRAGKGHHGFEFWQKGMVRRWRDPMARRGWPKYPGAVYKESYSNPPLGLRLKFKNLSIGDVFVFSSQDDPRFMGSGIAKGPWIKRGTREYEHVDDVGKPVAQKRYGAFRIIVGSINADVRKVQHAAHNKGRITVQYYRDRDGVIRHWGTGVKGSLPRRHVLLVDYRHGGIFDTWIEDGARSWQLVKSLDNPRRKRRR